MLLAVEAVPAAAAVLEVPAALNDDCGDGVVAGVVGSGRVVTLGATPRTTGGPSGSTQFTSLLEQKSGMDVRSVEISAAHASPAPNAARALTDAASLTKLSIFV